MAKYDGWVITDGREIFPWTFSERRSGTIGRWGKIGWERQRKKGEYKTIKVKLVEVE